MSTGLLSKSEREYGTDYRSHFFDQYKLYVESIEKISDRRQAANGFFLTINTALITLIGLSFGIEKINHLNYVKALIAVVGLIICVIFWFLIRSYKQLNTGKFTVLHEIEKELPLALYKYEWGVLGEGKNKKLYYPFSHVEQLIPITFGIIYSLLIVVFIFL